MNFSLTIITNAAPSLVCEELPAVTEPFASNTGFNFANASTVVSARGPSSVSTMKSRFFFLPVASSIYVSVTFTGAISSLNLPSAIAFTALLCD